MTIVQYTIQYKNNIKDIEIKQSIEKVSGALESDQSEKKIRRRRTKINEELLR